MGVQTKIFVLNHLEKIQIRHWIAANEEIQIYENDFATF